jgi:ATP-dependent Clp protease adaptor protein ClpS
MLPEANSPMSEGTDDTTAVAEPVVNVQTSPEAKPDEKTRTKRQPPYHVILLNDEEHTFEYVIELLVKIFGHAKPTAEGLTLRIHLAGRAVVLTTHRELAELKREQVLAYGPDPRMSVSKGPLGCYIEASA